MKQQAPPDDLPDPEWGVPRPPALGPREWATLIFERFGFWIACAVTVVVLVFVYLSADQSPQKTATPDPAPLATTALAGVPLTITTTPATAAIFVDGEYVGVSPLHGVTLPEGRHLVSVLKPAYASIDTVVTLGQTSASIQFTLHSAETARVADDPAPDAVLRDRVPATPAPAPKEARPEPDRAIQEEEPAVARVAADPPVQVGDLQVISAPSGASVLVAGRVVGVTPVRVSALPAGPHQIILRLGGYTDFSATVEVVAQQQRTLNGRLQPRLGTLKILVKPWGAIYIDGVLHKQEASIWYVARLSPGRHRVRVAHPSLGQRERVVEVVAGEEQALTIDLNN